MPVVEYFCGAQVYQYLQLESLLGARRVSISHSCCDNNQEAVPRSLGTSQHTSRLLTYCVGTY
jgi:hypothetical protein